MKFNWNDRNDRGWITGITLSIWWAILIYMEGDTHWFLCLGGGSLVLIYFIGVWALVTLLILAFYESWIVRFFPKLNSRFPNLHIENSYTFSKPAWLVSNFYVLINYSFGRTSFTLFENYTICLPMREFILKFFFGS